MEKVTAYLLTWTEAEEALQCVLDDIGIKLTREDSDLYNASSDTQKLDAGQVDERLAQHIGINECIGWATEDGIIIIDKSLIKS